MNKQMTAAEVVAQLRDGMTIGIGGWGPRRKPMAIVREILRSDLKDLTIVAYGGPDVGMLCAAGKVRKLVYAFVSLDAIPLEPYFRKAREAGQIAVSELDEGMLQWGLRAAAMRLPFLPTRVGLATDIMTHNPDIKTIRSPYADGELLAAMPAIALDAALLHVDLGDRLGNTQIGGPDPFFDDLFARAAQRCYVSCDRLVERVEDDDAFQPKANFFERYLVSGVVHAPGGAHPTSCAPHYGWDLDHLKKYVASAAEDGGWARYVGEFVAGTEEHYLRRVGGMERVAQLPLPIF
ncbi:CoA transferase subunit A [Pseudoduganella namucuonensis]|uniref:Glutaconate CoA-transferase subunit A n=1 Tax=Pseudoduganella namucuonensis TaxID=1035707 RepID=A0A1I7LS59_9BURK|nr:CoA-transferase [Pseudoduganella namucuonensis]SFV12513.1 glutaconate CoA-transferase subunit A [Pseudoduganella namucuonensis]